MEQVKVPQLRFVKPSKLQDEYKKGQLILEGIYEGEVSNKHEEGKMDFKFTENEMDVAIINRAAHLAKNLENVPVGSKVQVFYVDSFKMTMGKGKGKIKHLFNVKVEKDGEFKAALDENKVEFVNGKNLESGWNVEGIFTGTMANKKFPDSPSFKIKTPEGENVIINSCASLKAQFRMIEQGDYIRVEFEGSEDTEKGTKYNFVVYK